MTGNSSIYKLVCFSQQTTHGINTVIQIQLDLVEITIIGIGNFRRNIALGDTIDILGGYIDRPDKCIAQIINTTYQGSPATNKLGYITTGCQLTCNRSLDQLICFSQQSNHGIDTVVQVQLDLVEITIVVVGDLGWNITLGNAVDILGSYIQRTDNGIQSFVDTGYDFLKFSLVF